MTSDPEPENHADVDEPVDPGPRLNRPEAPRPDPFAYFQAVDGREEHQRRRWSLPSRRIALIPAVLLVMAVAVLGVRFTTGSWLGGFNESEPAVESSGVRFCRDLGRTTENRIEAAIHEMRSAGEGELLFQVLLDNGVCLEVDKLRDLDGYFATVGGPAAEEIAFIVLNHYMLEIALPDEIAALLVHEATHARRWYDGSSCYGQVECTWLPNGAALEEEVAAHRAEAIWWRERHGPSGTSNGVSYGGTVYSGVENNLLAALDAGPDAFTDYVRERRSSLAEARDLPPPPFASEDD